jgi:perosamine synthetase
METSKRPLAVKHTQHKKIPLQIYDQEKCLLFALGRNAIYTVCESMGLKKGDVVLTPAFDCDSTLTPFRVLGLTLEFYRSDPYTFEVDIEDIKCRLTPKVKLLHIINHFGIPQPWDSLLELRKKTNIPILEDNAYSLFSKYKGRLFGSFGDFSVFSLYKMLPVIDGGMLRVNNPEYSVEIPERMPKWFYPSERKKVIGLIASQFGYDHLSGKLKKRIRPVNKPLPPLYSDKPGYPEWHLRDVILDKFSSDYYRPMSKIAQMQLRKYSTNDFSVVSEKIRYFYKLVVESLQDVKGIKVLWPETPEGVIPSCVSILVDIHRDDVLYILKSKRIGVIAWPTFSGDVIDRIGEYPEIEIIGKKILQLMIPAFRVLKKDADLYFKNLTNEVINCISSFQPR